MAEMISAGDFRNGVTIEFEGNIYHIIEFPPYQPVCPKNLASCGSLLK